MNASVKTPIFVPGRPVWLLGVGGVIDGLRSGLSRRTVDLSSWDRRLGEQGVHPALVTTIWEAHWAGIDVRWLAGSEREEAIALALTGQLIARQMPEPPVLTEADLPEGYEFPGGGWTRTAGRVMWQADLVRHLVPDTSPLLWTPGWDYLSESTKYQCGDPARGRRPADVIDSRTAATTIPLPQPNPLRYMTAGDLRKIDRWIDEHREDESDG